MSDPTNTTHLGWCGTLSHPATAHDRLDSCVEFVSYDEKVNRPTAVVLLLDDLVESLKATNASLDRIIAAERV